MPELSVILITRNEAANLRDCLASVVWADEIVVVDYASSDGTPTSARELGARVIETTDWPGFGPQKNRALANVTGDWVLAIDADERVTPELRVEIEQAIARGDCVAYVIPRLSSYCGRFMRHSGWWPDPVRRLFKRGRARFSEDRIHERLVVEGMVGTLSAPLLHYSFRDLEQVLAKVNHYSTESARMLQAQGRRAGLGTAISHGLWAFLRTYLFQLGFLDGREGFMLAVSNAEGSYYRYLKLMYLGESGYPLDD
jgi:glycosyltransferase involved in cell wall biosynthesis